MLKEIRYYYDFRCKNPQNLHIRGYEDEKHNVQGEYKVWHGNGQLKVYCIYKDNVLHGEYKSWYSDGQPQYHCFYKNSVIITNQIKELVKDINNITEQERMLIKLKFDISTLSIGDIC